MSVFPAPRRRARLPVCPASVITFQRLQPSFEKDLSGTTHSRRQQGWGRALFKVWVFAACILSPGGPALPRLMILRFHRLPDNLSTGFHLSLGHLVTSGLIGEWL